jgi:hypothetical protein
MPDCHLALPSWFMQKKLKSQLRFSIWLPVNALSVIQTTAKPTQENTTAAMLCLTTPHYSNPYSPYMLVLLNARR